MELILLAIGAFALFGLLAAIDVTLKKGGGLFTDADGDGEPDETPEEKARALEDIDGR